MNITLGIPCTIKHLSFLKELLKSIHNQSFKPNEVLISLSECHEEINLNHIYPCRIIINKEKKTAGENRNIIIENSNNDIISFIDADDLMQPNRLKMIKLLFEENKKIKLMLHDSISYQRYLNKNPLKFSIIYGNELKEKLKFGTSLQTTLGDIRDRKTQKLHNGHITINRKNLTLRFSNLPHGEDKEFVNNFISKCNPDEVIYLRYPLSIYNKYKSSRYHS